MENEKVIWYKKPINWAAIVALIAVIVTIILHYDSKSADFTIIVSPIDGIVTKGGQITTNVTIESQKFKSPIRLTTKSQNDKIDISFLPSSGIPNPTFQSIVTIKAANNIAVGEYLLEIVGIGTLNNKDHSTNFVLKVTNPPFSSQDMVNLFFPDGFMGDAQDISLDVNSSIKPFSGNSCIKITYSPHGNKRWAGIYWMYPNNNWGNTPEGRNLVGATKLTFMARGDRGGEQAEFKVGGISGKFSDSVDPPVLIIITLTSDWKVYTLDLKGKDLGNVFGGFCWVTNTSQNPKGCEIYLDDIVYQ